MGQPHSCRGGNALLVYVPLYDDGKDEAWGILSAAINLDILFAQHNISVNHPDLEISVGKQNPNGQLTPILFGSHRTFERDPVTYVITLANTDWLLGAVPYRGWNEPLALALPRLFVIGGLGLLITAAVLGIAHLMRLRLAYVQKLRAKETDVRQLSRRMEMALSASGIGVWELDLQTGEALWDDRMYALYGAEPDAERAGFAIWRDCLHPDEREKQLARLEINIAEGQPFKNTFRIIRSDGMVRHIQVIGDFVHDKDGQSHIIGINSDVTDEVLLHEELKRANREARQQNEALEKAQKVLRHNTLHDALTELPNRQYLEQAFVTGNEAVNMLPPFAVLSIDLDRFKEINDTLGHSAGDAMLRHSARMLQSIARPEDFIARIGGDEFALVTHWDGNADALAQLANEIMRALGKPLRYGEHHCRVSASVGIAWMDEGTSGMRDVLINASIALYEAKRVGRNRMVIFDAVLRNVALTNKKTADELLEALEANQFSVSYQPQINAETLELCGAEALVRWQHPTRGSLAPGHFIGTAETIGAIARIDEVVLKKAVAQYWTWREKGLAVPHISVNISAQRLADEQLFQSIAEADVPAGALRFELLESISFETEDQNLEERVARIKSVGIDIEIDDFGTGYASIVSLLSLAPKSLKIDRQLVMPITKSLSERRLVAAIIEIGRALGIQIIAEGVETLEHARILREMGVDSLQGYFFAPPLSAEELERFAQKRDWMRHFID